MKVDISMGETSLVEIRAIVIQSETCSSCLTHLFAVFDFNDSGDGIETAHFIRHVASVDP